MWKMRGRLFFSRGPVGRLGRARQRIDRGKRFFQAVHLREFAEGLQCDEV